MIDSKLEKEYERLEERDKRYQRYARPRRLIRKWAAYVFLLILLIGILVGVILNLQTGLVQTYTYSAMYAWIAIAGISYYLLGRKERVYRLDVDERSILHTCSILNNLDNYFDSDKPELKKEYKENMLRHANMLLSTVENDWTIGEFRLGKEVFGDSISKFKKNLRDRLIPHIEKGDETSLKTVGQIIYNFAQFLHFPSIEDLNHLNKSISEQIGSYPSAKIGFFRKCLDFLKIHKAFKHALAMGSIIILCYFVYFLGNYISPEAAYISAVALFGVLLVGYLQYIKKE